MMERLTLSFERIREIRKENIVKEPFLDYFREMASFIEMIEEIIQRREDKSLYQLSLEELEQFNQKLYQDLLPDHYEKSYGNPQFAVKYLTKEYGQMLSFVYSQLRGMVPFAFEGKYEDVAILLEVFLEIYNSFLTEAEENLLPDAENIRQTIYWFISDYCDVTVVGRIQEQLDPKNSFAKDMIMNSDLNDLRYLYYFGEYISKNEIESANYLNSLSNSKIIEMAKTFTEGFRIGFVNTGKDLSKKRVVNIRYTLGFERMVRQAILNFKDMGLEPTIYRSASHAANKSGTSKVGFYGAIPNKQFEFDHKEDLALWMDKAFINRKLEVLRTTYEENKQLAAYHAGPAIIEVFGENPFAPVKKEEALALSEKQQKLSVEYASCAGEIVNEYIKGEERSFTIIAYPIPEIGEKYEEIFEETVKINTLDYNKYLSMQQAMIDLLDTGEYVEITGKGDNKTDMKVYLHEISDSVKETKFENCVADVNIPVGEVFTSPVLKGTTGRLYVSEVFLHDLKYINLEIDFVDGMVTDYICSNFDNDEDNRKYIKDNLLYHHESLPLGEFAIGSNTTAFAMAKKYNIFDKLPILIAEKTGPHFALGDTCYSHAEDVKVYNPNGKEIVARENEISILRKEDTKKAYFNCHTDITIPYHELGEIVVVTKMGERVPLIQDGKFVLEKCLELNIPLKNLD